MGSRLVETATALSLAAGDLAKYASKWEASRVQRRHKTVAGDAKAVLALRDKVEFVGGLFEQLKLAAGRPRSVAE